MEQKRAGFNNGASILNPTVVLRVTLPGTTTLEATGFRNAVISAVTAAKDTREEVSSFRALRKSGRIIVYHRVISMVWYMMVDSRRSKSSKYSLEHS